MVQPRYSPFEQIINNQKKQDTNKENSTRLAHSRGSFKTTGWGETTPEEHIEFEAPFLYRPSHTTGWSFESDDDEAELRATRYPRVSAGVRRWNRNNNGFYTGAYVVLVVEDRSALIAPTDPDPDPTYNIIHDFVFEGIAIKDLPSVLRGDLNEV